MTPGTAVAADDPTLRQLFQGLYWSADMLYRIERPEARLEGRVHGIWVQEDLSPAAPMQECPTRVLPTGNAVLGIYYGDPFFIVDKGLQELPRVCLHGPTTKPIDVMASGRTGVLLVHFRPWAAADFFHRSASDLTDRWCDLGLLVGDSLVASLLERVEACRSAQGRAAIVQDFLQDHHRSRQDQMVREGVCMLGRAGGRFSISDLSRRLGYGRRHVARRFKEACGLGPKTLARIFRFQQALGAKRSGLPWEAIAERCGYYDQAHFINEIRSFSGYSPERVFSVRRQTSLMVHFNSSESHFSNTTYL